MLRWSAICDSVYRNSNGGVAENEAATKIVEVNVKKDYQLTRGGIEALEVEIEELKGKRREIADKIKTAREFGDLSENAEYHAAMDEHQKTEARIFEIEHIFKNVEVVEKPQNTTEVELGNTVTLKSDSGVKTFTVVGSVEANPLESKVSNASPIGAALMGKKKGDTVEAGNTVYTITEIS